MRVSTIVSHQIGVRTMQTQEAKLLHTMEQLASGRRILTPADDPLGAAQAVNVAQTESMNLRFAQNRDVARQSLSLQEQTLTSMTKVLQNVSERIVQAGNGTYSDAERLALANDLRETYKTLLGQANATDGSGQYMFSGNKGTVAPFTESGGVVTYVGDDGTRDVQVGQTRQIASVDAGNAIFMRASPGTQLYVGNANPANTGSGTFGKVQITNPQGAWAGQAFAIAFEDDGAGGLTMRVTDPTSGNEYVGISGQPYVAGENIDLGGVSVPISGEPQAGDSFTFMPVNGAAVSYSSTPDAGNDPTTDFVMGKPRVADNAAIDPDGAYTIEFADDGAGGFNYTVTNTVSGTTATGAYVEGTDIEFEGLAFAASGTPADGDAFTIERSATGGGEVELDMFSTLDALIKALETPTVGDPVAQAEVANALSRASRQVSVHLDNVLTVRASVGARLNELDALDDEGSTRDLNYKAQLSSIESVDYRAASSQLAVQSMALQAAELAYMKIKDLGLFNRR